MSAREIFNRWADRHPVTFGLAFVMGPMVASMALLRLAFHLMAP